MSLPDADDSDDALLDAVQRQTLRYFWEFAHKPSGLALDRSTPDPGYGPDAVAVGGSGFGLMAIVAGVERGWIPRAEAVERLRRVLAFLERADSFHGVLPHFLDGRTGRAIRFTRKDDAADLVETAFLMMGLLCCRQYFLGHDAGEIEIRQKADRLWREVEWSWHTRDGEDLLYWHWSPNNGWAMNFPIRGWNECLIAYVLAASSPTYPIPPTVYHHGWAGGPHFRNGREFYGIRLPLGPDFGSSLCFSQYSFMGLDPRGLVDRYADYWEQNVAHTRINYEHCVRNPNAYEGYGPDCWGLTASDDDYGYNQHAPDVDLGVISPTAALSAMPYAPDRSMAALRTFLGRLKRRLWTQRGLRDAFSEARGWYAPSTLAIDQGPIVVMIENHRSGLLWDLFMSCDEVRAGLARLGFASPRLGARSVANGRAQGRAHG
ncbi:DUF3131 domain-containing protein [Alsobacter sp. SYSU M60028]|uniref:DUF3131 domain-containing protein n=1 Tax=Alsobacter ponti TaxID=2962936 RepID=A0ABT1LJQ6_9HYPH|nr:glucoamylase family protein [Alsobacter ponti]MCP8940970.1 DUF3131 domain-containing protein [Alsobacter ponti]